MIASIASFVLQLVGAVTLLVLAWCAIEDRYQLWKHRKNQAGAKQSALLEYEEFVLNEQAELLSYLVLQDPDHTFLRLDWPAPSSPDNEGHQWRTKLLNELKEFSTGHAQVHPFFNDGVTLNAIVGFANSDDALMCMLKYDARAL